MEIKDIRKMSKEEIMKEVASAKAELARLKYDIRLGKEKDTSKNLKIKQNIARMLTVLNEKEITDGKEK